MAIGSKLFRQGNVWLRRCLIGSLLSVMVCLVTPGLLCAQAPDQEAEPRDGLSLFASRQMREDAISAMPMNRLTSAARERIRTIVKSPTIYRRLPAQAIDCDRDMFLFLTRNPEVLVGLWDLMGVTNVTVERTGPYQLKAQDGSGTTCLVDLIYGDASTHIFIADGSYDGKLVTKPILGHGVFLLRSSYATNQDGGTTVAGTLDCFVQFDSLGADLVARTLSGIIGRSADNNFFETARFISQVSQASEHNPNAMLDVGSRIPQVSDPIRKQFLDTVSTVAQRAIELNRRRPRSETRTATIEVPGLSSR